MKITATSVKQPGNETLGTKDKELYYLVIENKKAEKVVVNVGKKTHDSVQELTKNDK